MIPEIYKIMEEKHTTSESTEQDFEFIEVKLEPLEDEELAQIRSSSPGNQIPPTDERKAFENKVKTEDQKNEKFPNDEKSNVIKTENDSLHGSDISIWEPGQKNVQENVSKQNEKCFLKNTNNLKHSPLYPLEFENKSLEETGKTDEQTKRHFQCRVCQKLFTFFRNLERHMVVHRTENVYECNTCGKCFTKRGHFEEHSTVHSDARPYLCDICNRSFKWKSTLARHSRLHTSNHPHHCPVCNKVFTTRQHLERHIQTHTGEKPFKCHICQNSFSQSSSLTRHLVIHSGDRPHVCLVCNKAFSFQNDLKIHTRIHTGEKPYSCPVCSKSFTQKGNLVIHMRVHKPK